MKIKNLSWGGKDPSPTEIHDNSIYNNDEKSNFYTKIDGSIVKYEKPHNQRQKDFIRNAFKTNEQLLLTSKEKTYLNTLDDVQLGKTKVGVIGIDKDLGKVVMDTGIYEKIWKKHGPINNRNMVATVNRWKYKIINRGGNPDVVNYIKPFSKNSEYGLLVGATKNKNGLFVTTHYEPRVKIADFLQKEQSKGGIITTKNKPSEKLSYINRNLDAPTISQTEAKNIVRKYFKDDQVAVKLADRIVTNDEIEAFGMYKDKMIAFAKNPTKYTPEHEVFHAYFDMALKPKEKNAILKAIQKQENFKTKLDAEEFMADAFAEFVVGRKERSKHLTGKLQNIFQDLAYMFKNFFGKSDKVEGLYRELESVGRGKRKLLLSQSGTRSARFLKVSNEKIARTQNYDITKLKEQINYTKEFQKLPKGDQIREGFREKLSIFHPETRGKIESIEKIIKEEANYQEKPRPQKQKITLKRDIENPDQETIDFVKKYRSGEEMYEISGEKGRDIFESYGIEGKQAKIDFWETIMKKSGANMEEFKNTSYMMSHRPNKGAPGYDMLSGEYPLPKDFYENPEKTFIMSDAEWESFRALKSIRGNPEAKVVIYRGAPKGEFHYGDWITLSKTYATQHVKSNVPGGKVYKKTVKAKDIYFAGDDIKEFGYFPKGKTPLKPGKSSEKLLITDKGAKLLANTSRKFDENFRKISEEKMRKMMTAINNNKAYFLKYKPKQEVIDLIKAELGIDIKGQLVSSYGIRHILKGHGPNSGDKIPVTIQDIQYIPEIQTNYDRVKISPNTNKKGEPVLIYEKKIDGVYYYLEKINKNGFLDTQTMYIKDTIKKNF